MENKERECAKESKEVQKESKEVRDWRSEDIQRRSKMGKLPTFSAPNQA
jgi:hypothetical protein